MISVTAQLNYEKNQPIVNLYLRTCLTQGNTHCIHACSIFYFWRAYIDLVGFHCLRLMPSSVWDRQYLRKMQWLPSCYLSHRWPSNMVNNAQQILSLGCITGTFCQSEKILYPLIAVSEFQIKIQNFYCWRLVLEKSVSLTSLLSLSAVHNKATGLNQACPSCWLIWGIAPPNIGSG